MILVLGGGWFVPSEMRRIHNNLVKRGTDPALFDATIEGRMFRTGVRLCIVAGVVAIALGLYDLVSA
ncbi:MAG TPA: hypothetical protein VFG42_24740 [Baekduia sp.]|uniref:hypothetical protein n=1 Tax=Baekduia sp. TaxID=2600305 RepID=UPI002D7A0CBA|nr:hypothetical protein [Baekduia sp.]HET6510025.1 hypothetical protein [Baekduia sp.]